MAVTEQSRAHWDPYNQTYFKDPHSAFRRLRAEAPLYYNEEYDFYAVSRYADVERALMDWESFSSARGDIMELIKANQPIPRGAFIMEDPPIHTAHRKALTRVFTPRRMASLEPQIRAFCAKSLDPLVGGGEFDFIENLGMEMPMRVISMLLGIPEEDQKAVQAMVNSNLTTEAGKPMDVENNRGMGEGFEEYIDYRIKHPSDDLMSELLSMEFEDENKQPRKFKREEVLVIANIIAGAGNETTNRLIGWTGKLLAEHPDQRRKIVEDRKLINQTIEEVLRYEPPGSSIARYVTKDSEFHGQKVPAGSVLLALVGAANRDSAQFENPDQFNIERERKAHLTFGYGFHNCIGNALARAEGRIALDEILNRFPEWEVDLDNAYLSSTSTVRGWETLPAYVPGTVRKPRVKKEAVVEAPPEGAEKWAITLKTIMGPQEMTLWLVRDGATLSGRIESEMGGEPIKDGKADGDKLSWKMSVTKPMPLTLEFEVEQQGASMTGSAKLGTFGTAEVVGTRA